MLSHTQVYQINTLPLEIESRTASSVPIASTLSAICLVNAGQQEDIEYLFISLQINLLSRDSCCNKHSNRRIPYASTTKCILLWSPFCLIQAALASFGYRCMWVFASIISHSKNQVIHHDFK